MKPRMIYQMMCNIGSVGRRIFDFWAAEIADARSLYQFHLLLSIPLTGSATSRLCRPDYVGRVLTIIIVLTLIVIAVGGPTQWEILPNQ